MGKVDSPQRAPRIQHGLRLERQRFVRQVLPHEVGLKAVGSSHLGFSEGDEVVEQRPLLAIPLETIGTGGAIAAVEQHPDQAVGFELLRERFSRLQELIAVIQPRWGNQSASSEND